jgi:acetylornithine/succinyldiaminopimelate/putrescine aminotransferase
MNTGAEAVETAIKAVRAGLTGKKVAGPNKAEIIACAMVIFTDGQLP